MNIHLTKVWTSKYLEKRIDKIADGAHEDFRLFLSAEPDHEMPVNILQACIKITNEPPEGLAQNQSKAYSMFSNEFFGNCSKPAELRQTVFSLTCFHAIMLQVLLNLFLLLLRCGDIEANPGPYTHLSFKPFANLVWTDSGCDLRVALDAAGTNSEVVRRAGKQCGSTKEVATANIKQWLRKFEKRDAAALSAVCDDEPGLDFDGGSSSAAFVFGPLQPPPAVAANPVASSSAPAGVIDL